MATAATKWSGASSTPTKWTSRTSTSTKRSATASGWCGVCTSRSWITSTTLLCWCSSPLLRSKWILIWTSWSGITSTTLLCWCSSSLLRSKWIWSWIIFVYLRIIIFRSGTHLWPIICCSCGSGRSSILTRRLICSIVIRMTVCPTSSSIKWGICVIVVFVV